MESKTSEQGVHLQTIFTDVFKTQTWKSLASANGCRGWCICDKPAKCKKGVAPCRCVPPTCAQVDLHHPTNFQKCLHFTFRG